MELHQLTEHCRYSDAVSDGDRPVLGLVAGRDNTLAVDCGNSPAHAQWLLDRAKALGLPPVRWAVLTHWHWDHVMGGRTMQEAGVSLICSRGTARQLEALRGLPWTDEAIAQRVAEGTEIPFCQEAIRVEYPENSRRLEAPTPQLVLDGPAELDLGGVAVSLLPHPSDHSMDGTLVHIPGDGAVFLGDSSYLNMYTSPWHYTREKLLPLLDTLEGLGADWYLPAHHDRMLTGADFSAFSRRQRRLCALVGEEVTIANPAARYAAEFGGEPGPGDLEELMAFVRGNLVKTR